MTDLLMIVGVIVFFISVYGAVMVGGHLLDHVAQAGDQTSLRVRSADPAEAIAGVETSPDRAADGPFPEPVAAA